MISRFHAFALIFHEVTRLLGSVKPFLGLETNFFSVGAHNCSVCGTYFAYI